GSGGSGSGCWRWPPSWQRPCWSDGAAPDPPSFRGRDRRDFAAAGTSHPMTGTPRPEWPDDVLVRRAVEDPGGPAGRAAACELLGRYQGRVYLWCYRYVRDHDRALDLAQDALLSAYRALATFQGRSRFSSWLFAIARNRCLTAVAPASLT